MSVTFPVELKRIPHWVVWRMEERKGKPTKVPYRADGNGTAAVDDPETWATARAAYDRAQTNGYSGFGFVVTKEDPYCGIDLDHCRNPETDPPHIEGWALEIVQAFNSYTEVTPSGSGLRIWIKGVLPAGRNREGNIELYDHNRYFTATGHHLAGTPETIEERQEALEALYTRLFPAPALRVVPDVSVTPSLTTYEITRRASAAENGPKFDRLMNGDRTGYTSDSEADLALCGILAFWTTDVAQIDQIVRSSGLYREKWARVDYAERTIRKALEEATEHWQGGEAGGQIIHGRVKSQSPRPAIEIYSAAELDGAEIPQPRAVVPGLIHVGLNMLAGKGKLGKSWIALNLALAVSTGGKALGSLPVQDGEVLYLALEDNKRRMQERIQMLRDGPFFPRRLHVTHLWPKLDEGGHEAIDEWLGKHPEATLVIVDVWKYIRHKRQRNANLYDEDYEHLVGLKAMADRRQVAMLVVHHTRKMAAEDAFDEISGSGAILAALDTCLILHRPRTEADGELWITGRDVEEAHWAMRFEAGAWTVLGSAAALKVSKERQMVTDAIAGVNRPVTIREVSEVTGKGYNATKVLMFKMLTAGELHRSNSLYSIPSNLVNPGNFGNSGNPGHQVGGKVTEVTDSPSRARAGCPACGRPAYSLEGDKRKCQNCGELY